MRTSRRDAASSIASGRLSTRSTIDASSPGSTTIDFPAGSTWIAFTDGVSHAAMAGQYQLEQTFLLPVEAMQKPERSPLRILERIKKRALV